MLFYYPFGCVLIVHYYELPKLPESIDTNNILELWLKLFSAKTEEELVKIDALEVPVMSEAIKAYQRVMTSAELRELERLRTKASHDEAQALHNARQNERKLWEGVVAEKDAEIATLQIQLRELNNKNH
ncbi:MAG: Rpn family recombination-promoting nuclease/putative transposase [Oscillospiraceae bacterium]|nr:Rpn family recombination-promoting nuclease/putative transposase [Oscillospiraceae bacterium]